jgi:hypothetical protein
MNQQRNIQSGYLRQRQLQRVKNKSEEQKKTAGSEIRGSKD